MINIFDITSPPLFGEHIDAICTYKNIEIKRIVSSDTLELTTFCQQEAEWVVLLEGSAELLMDEKRYVLEKGDSLFIPSLQAHTITNVAQGTLWLAIHIHDI